MQVTVWPRGTARTVYAGPLGILWNGNPQFVGTPIHSTSIGKLIEVKFSTRYEDGFGGHDLAEWTFIPLGGYIGGMFRPGDHVRIVKGGGTCFEGEFSEAVPADDGKVTLKAKGYAYNLYDYDSIYWRQRTGDDVFYPTNRLVGGNLTTSWYGWEYATTQLGMPISQVVGTIPTGTFGNVGTDLSREPVTLQAVMTARCREAGVRWAVWGRTLVIAADPTTVMWRYNSPDSVVGVADTEYATHVFVWYTTNGKGIWNPATNYALNAEVEYAGACWRSLQNGNTNHLPTELSSTWWTAIPCTRSPNDYSMVVAIDTVGLTRFDARTAVVDMTGLGQMASADAQTLANTLLSQVKGRFILSGSFTVTPDSGFTSANGGAADLAFVNAGTLLDLADLRTSQGNLMPDGGQAIIGKTDYTWQAPEQLGGEERETLTVTLMGTVPRNLGDILRGVPGNTANDLGAGE